MSGFGLGPMLAAFLGLGAGREAIESPANELTFDGGRLILSSSALVACSTGEATD